MVIASEKDGFYVLKYSHEAVMSYIEQSIPIPSDGIDEAFEVELEHPER